MKLTDKDKLAIKQQFMNLTERLTANITEALELVCEGTKSDADEAQVRTAIESILQTTVACIEQSTDNVAVELKKMAMEGYHGE